ncbi:unnamed protein product, partial [Meganyctiphanes norvegica]
EDHNPVYSRSESESPSRVGSQPIRQRVSTSRSRTSRSSSRPRPRSGEDIPLEDMHSTSDSHSSTQPKMNLGQSEKSGSSSSSETPDSTDGINDQHHAGPRDTFESSQCVSLVSGPSPVVVSHTRLMPALQGLTPLPVLSNNNLHIPVTSAKTVTSLPGDPLFPGDDVATPTPSPRTPQSPTYPEKETSFTKPPLTRTMAAAPGFNVFEPQVNGLGERMDPNRTNSPRNSLGSADFSPIRRVRVKGNIETV